jgi:hypothetical protein
MSGPCLKNKNKNINSSKQTLSTINYTLNYKG